MDFQNPFDWYQVAMSDPATFGPLMDGMGLDADTVQKAMQSGGFDPETRQMLAQMHATHMAGQAGNDQLAGGAGTDRFGPGQGDNPLGRGRMGPMAQHNLGSLTEPLPTRGIGGDIGREPGPTYPPPQGAAYSPETPPQAGPMPLNMERSAGIGSDYAQNPAEGAGGAVAGPAIPPGAYRTQAGGIGNTADPRIAAQRQLAAQQGYVGPKPPNPPPMHGGVTGGVKVPEAKAIKPGSAAIQALLAALQQKPVPTLGHLVG